MPIKHICTKANTGVFNRNGSFNRKDGYATQNVLAHALAQTRKTPNWHVGDPRVFVGGGPSRALIGTYPRGAYSRANLGPYPYTAQLWRIPWRIPARGENSICVTQGCLLGEGRRVH